MEDERGAGLHRGEAATITPAMTTRVFIDGDVGTTGLQIRARLEGRADIELLRLPEAQRKLPAERARMLNAAEVVILCLPDDAAREAVAWIDNPAVRVIDASTAHRVDPGWVYGFPEMDEAQEAAVRAAKRVTNPGCYPTGFVALVRPLVQAGLLPAAQPLTVHAISGYSGGGRGLIERFEDPANADPVHDVYRSYALGLQHKHVPEMQRYGLLDHAPIFVPSIARFRQGMLVHVPLALWSLPAQPSVEQVHATLQAAYAGQTFVSVAPLAESMQLEHLEPEGLNHTNDMRLFVCANRARQQVVLVAQLDNLGKGASGAAVQNLNTMLGWPADTGLRAAAA